jgi:G3E family GTPase
VPQWVELANGCLCCSVKAEFVQALEGLLGAGSQHAGKFDYVLVETTGAAFGQHTTVMWWRAV